MGWALLGFASFVAFIVFIILATIASFKKNGKAKKNVLLTGVCFVVFIIAIAATPQTDKQAAPPMQAEPTTKTAEVAATAEVKPEPAKTPEPKPAPKQEPKQEAATFTLNQTAKAGNLAFVASDVRTASFIGDNQYLRKKTENLFVVVKVKITNNDKAARTIDTNLFKLKDSSGKEYSAMVDADLYVNDPGQSFFLAQVNPGVDKSGYIVFEIPQGLAGLKLECSSGLGFTGGKFATIDLGI